METDALRNKHVATHPCLLVTIVRHAETRLNKKGRGGRYMQGQLNEDLTDKGLLQAKALAYRLRKHQFHKIITSDLKQAVQTTAEIEKYQKEAKVTTDVRLREQDLGDLAGKKIPEVQRILKAADNHQDGYLKHKGEPMESFKTRMLDFYHDVIIENLVEPHYDFLDKVAEEDAKREEAKAKNHSKQLQTNLVPPAILEGAESSTPQIAPIEVANAGTTTSSVSNTTSPNRPSILDTKKRQRRPQFPQQRVLLVTHGGCIRLLLKHLMSDLGFPVKEPHPGFPKPTSVNQFVICKKFWNDGDYEWSGLVLHMNNVAHLADMDKRHGPKADLTGNGNVATTVDGKTLKKGNDVAVRKHHDTGPLPGLPAKSESYERDRSTDDWPTPQVSPEQQSPPEIGVSKGPKKSLGW
ncbi:histidine phosphatase superfamily [Chytriomyces cf. hyalinus JEL632]|nr:histidine phosphatase superfamily [Chytriomyces cf. hyalinus JEL632]